MASHESISQEDRETFSGKSREELLVMIQQLKTEVSSLRQSQQLEEEKNADGGSTKESLGKYKKKRTQRPFDFSKYNKRHVALRIAYLGWDYQGFASQENTENTVEAEIFQALTKTRLIKNRETANYSRCGRTDKGVSAFGQVISIDLRSNLLEGSGVIQTIDGTAQERSGNKEVEIEYTHILNRVLPETIRCIAWTPVDPKFDARFSALYRTYKYFIPRGDSDIELMRNSAQKYVGDHDFRNFCKMDVGNGVVNFWRTILSIDIQELDSRDDGYQMYELTVTGQAFLYHQVRCMVAILLLIGQHKEQPEIIDRLLDVKTQPCKPQYSMASEYPLVLYDCAYRGIHWIYEQGDQKHNISRLQSMWAHNVVRTATLKRMLDGLQSAPVQTLKTESSGQDQTNQREEDASLRPIITNQTAFLLLGTKSKSYKPLLQRPVCESLEDRIRHFTKKRRIETIDTSE
ncbi:tRNA pseudouridine(38/39) synthase-like [Asterias rubens]|uniref:tRNA pseudouridine(38/39) synthase-like n=1 Tax=Asterias rubens TaxID=7604 RepID=UPI0014552972|nr:tRNA pseudouridine(38/39) synthase-like [Asterias rubens]